MEMFVVFDIGSSSTRCSAYKVGADGNVSPVMVSQEDGSNAPCSVSRERRNVEPTTGRVLLGGSGEDSTSLLDEIDDCVDDLLKILREHLRDSFHVSAVGFTSFAMCLVAVDENGEPVPANDDDGDGTLSISYACNTPEVTAVCKELHGLDPDEMYRRTGAPIHNSYALPQLRAACDPRVRRWQTIPSLCLSRWLGKTEMPISYSEASWTGLLNFATCKYDEKALSLLPEACRVALPELEDYDDGEYRMSSDASKPCCERWPEIRDARLFLGLGDGACANLGSKCSTSSRIAVTVGTSAAARICLPQEIDDKCAIVVPSGLFCYRIDKSRVLVGGALTDGGSVIEWASQLLGLNRTDGAFLDCMKEVEELYDSECEICKGNCDISRPFALTTVPFLSGERSTGYRVSARGAMIGFTRDTTPAKFMKSCMEGVVLRLRAVLELVMKARNDEGGDLPCIVISGKALEKNKAWRQMLADATGLNVVIDGETTEGTSRGVALLLASAWRKSRSDEEPVHPSDVREPRDAGRNYFDEVARAQDQFLDAISPLFESS